MGKVHMKQIRIKPRHQEINFKDVAAVADLMVWTGRLPTVSAICEELGARSIDRVRQCFELWKAGYNHIHAEKTHIADLPSELQHLLSDAFEQRAAASKAKLDAELAEIQAQRDRLLIVAEQHAAQIRQLNAALMDAVSKVDEQAKRIAMLENAIASGRDIRTKLEPRSKDASRNLTGVEQRLEDRNG